LRMYSHSLRIASPRDSGLLPTMCASSGVGVTTPPMAPRVVRPEVCGDLMTRCLLSFFPLIGMRFLRSTTCARENLAGPVERDLRNHFLELRRRAEKERAVDGIDLDAVRDFVSANVLLAPAHLRDLARILPAIAQILGHALDAREVAHALHE